MLIYRLVRNCFIILTLILSGCASNGLFYWGEYEQSLYQRYVENDSEQADIYLRETLDEALSNNRIPPGLYADYGFILYQQGNKNAAIDFFEKEKSLFPESSALMSKLIEKVKKQSFQTNSNGFISNGVNQ